MALGITEGIAKGLGKLQLHRLRDDMTGGQAPSVDITVLPVDTQRAFLDGLAEEVALNLTQRYRRVDEFHLDLPLVAALYQAGVGISVDVLRQAIEEKQDPERRAPGADFERTLQHLHWLEHIAAQPDKNTDEEYNAVTLQFIDPRYRSREGKEHRPLTLHVAQNFPEPAKDQQVFTPYSGTNIFKAAGA